MTIFLASLGFGLVTSSVLAIAAVGFTLQFGVTDVLNLAYGAVMIAGAYIAYVVNSHGVNIWIALVVAVVLCSAGSVLLNAFVYTPFQRRGTAPITMVIVSLGMTLIIEFGGRVHADRGAVRGDRAVPGRHGRNARAPALHEARQGHARDGRQTEPGPQLRHQDRAGDHRHLGDHRGAVRPGRRGLRDGRGQLHGDEHRPL